MYSRHNKGKSVVAEKFIGTLKSRVWKYMKIQDKKCVYW